MAVHPARPQGAVPADLAVIAQHRALSHDRRPGQHGAVLQARAVAQPQVSFGHHAVADDGILAQHQPPADLGAVVDAGRGGEDIPLHLGRHGVDDPVVGLQDVPRLVQVDVIAGRFHGQHGRCAMVIDDHLQRLGDLGLRGRHAAHGHLGHHPGVVAQKRQRLAAQGIDAAQAIASPARVSLHPAQHVAIGMGDDPVLGPFLTQGLDQGRRQETLSAKALDHGGQVLARRGHVPVDDQERLILQLARPQPGRSRRAPWLRLAHICDLAPRIAPCAPQRGTDAALPCPKGGPRPDDDDDLCYPQGNQVLHQPPHQGHVGDGKGGLVAHDIVRPKAGAGAGGQHHSGLDRVLHLQLQV